MFLSIEAFFRRFAVGMAAHVISCWRSVSAYVFDCLQTRIRSDWQKTRVAAENALADLKAEVERCQQQGVSLAFCVLIRIFCDPLPWKTRTF